METIAFLCCAQNISEFVSHTFYNLIKLATPFKQAYIYIYENDSSDNTLDILRELKYKHESNSNIKHITLRVFTSSGLSDKITLRTHRLAYIRNFLKNEAAKIDNLDYIVVADLDNVTYFVNEKGFFDSIQLLEQNTFADGIFATFYDKDKQLHYYDKWALRYENFDYNCIDGIHYMQVLMKTLIHNIDKSQMQDIMGEWFLHNHPDVNKLTNKLKNNEIVKVKSAFGGMGIYKGHVYFQGEYNGENKNPFFKVKNLPPLIKYIEECEHIPFHESMSKNIGRPVNFYINPQFIISEINL